MFHTPEFKKTARDVCGYLKTLPLSNTQHNQLVGLLIEQVAAAEKGGFYAGLEIGMDIPKAKPSTAV